MFKSLLYGVLLGYSLWVLGYITGITPEEYRNLVAIGTGMLSGFIGIIAILR